MTDQTTAAQPSNDPAPSNAEPVSNDTSQATEDVSERLFNEYAAKSNERLSTTDAPPIPPGGAEDDDPPGPTPELTDTPEKSGVSTSDDANGEAAPGGAAAATAPTDGKPAAGAAPNEPTVDELLADVPDHLRPALKAKLEREAAARAEAEAKAREADHKFRSERGRAEALARRRDSAAPSKDATPHAPKKPEENVATWTQFEKQYPTVADAMKSLFAIKGGNVEDMGSLLEFVAEQRAATEFATSSKIVDDVHPGWFATSRTPEFKQWIAQQPPKIQAWANSPEPEDAILLFDRYNGMGGRMSPSPSPNPAPENRPAAAPPVDAAASALLARRALQQDGARQPTVKGGGTPDMQHDPNDPDALFNAYAAKSNKRLKESGLA